MKLLGSNDDGGGRGPPIRTQDDAAVGYVFQRHPHDQEFPQFAQKQPRWASGDDAIIDNQDKWKYNPSLINTTQTCGGGVQLQTTTNSTNLIKPMQMQSQQQQQQQHHQMHQQQNHNTMGLQQNHMNTQQMLNHALNNSGGGLPPPPPQMQMPPQMTQGGMYDHMHSVNLNGVGGPKEQQQQQQQLVYLGGQPPMSVLAPQNQYMTAARNAAITTSAAKKLWEKGGGDVKVPSHGSSGLTPLQLHGGPEHQVWRDSTWSTQGEPILAPRRSAYQQAPVDANPTGSVGILSPRDSTGGLGVKMVEYVLGGSPTNKESPLASLEPRLRNLKFDDNDKSIDDKEKSNSPFDSNGLKKEETTTNGVMNGIDDDKGFNRTPGSRQPSPAEEALQRPNNNILDGSGQIGGGQIGGGGGSFQQHNLQHMLSGVATSGNDLQSCHLGSYHHQLQMNQLQAPVLNGVGNMHPAIQQNQMVNQQQGLNQVDSSANLLQQQHNFDVQQLFRSQNPGLAANGGGQGAPNGQSLQALPLPSQQFLAQQNAYAAPQAAPYVINPGQDATQYMGLIPSMPQYYNLPWPVYPGNLIPQQGTQPRRPLTPSQQGQPDYQIVPFYENSQILMGPRNGTQMRLVSPASVMVPPGAPRAPQVPSIYPPQPQTAQQSLYSTQNGSSVGGLALNTSSLSARRDSFDRNTSAFSPSLDYTSSTNSNSGINSGVRKWPVGSYGALGTVATASASPLAPAITPPPALGGLVSNRAPGAETKYRNVNQLAPVGLSANAMFGSNNSLFSKMTGAGSVVRPTTTASAAAAVAAAAAASAASAVTPLDQQRQQGRSRLLEDFRNQRFPNLQLRDLANHIVEFSQDQHGSRFIQQKLERATVTEKQMVFNEILNAAYSLMTDVFGNYVIQKFFEFGTPEQKCTLANQIKGHVLPLALQMYGCRVIQKALESITTEQQQEIVRELDGHVLKCVKDQNGNHVVQKCIECVDAGALQFIINAFGSQVYSLSTHPYGCRVIQRILEHCTQEQTAPILAELHSHTDQLIQDQYGNYVIQHVLEHGKQEDKSALIAAVRNKVLVLSQHKFASNVVEKCVTHATRSERALLLEEVCSFNDNALHIMMKDQYANYVIQKMIDVSEPTQRKIIMHKIKPHVNLLKKYTYGKHIIAKLEKFFQKNSQPMQIGNLGGNESLGPIGPPPTNGVL